MSDEDTLRAQSEEDRWAQAEQRHLCILCERDCDCDDWSADQDLDCTTCKDCRAESHFGKWYQLLVAGKIG